MVAISKMLLIALLVNVIMGFGCMGAALSGIGLPLVPFIIVGMLFVNAILFFVCAFGCDKPSFMNENYLNYEKRLNNNSKDKQQY